MHCTSGLFRRQHHITRQQLIPLQMIQRIISQHLKQTLNIQYLGLVVQWLGRRTCDQQAVSLILGCAPPG